MNPPTKPSATPRTDAVAIQYGNNIRVIILPQTASDALLTSDEEAMLSMHSELAAAKAECERLKALSDNAASAMQWAKDEFAAMKVRAERAESVLTLYRSKLYRVKSILSSIDDDGTEQHQSATAERAEAEVLAQAELLGRSAEREADLLGKLSRAEAALAAARKDSQRFNLLATLLEDVNIGDIDPTKHRTEDNEWPDAWRAAIDAAMTNSNHKTT